MLALTLTLSLLFSGALSLLCPNVDDPSITFNLAHPTSCGKYMTCVYGQPFEMPCPGQLEWNDIKSFCDYHEDAGCSRQVPEEVARLNGSALAKASVCLPQEVSKCPSDSAPGEVAFIKHRDCTKYVACTSDGENAMNCPQGLYWNARSCRCDYGSDAECGDGGERPVEEEEEQPEEDGEVPEEVKEEPEDQPEEQPEQQQEDQPEEHPEEPQQDEKQSDYSIPEHVPFDPYQPAILLQEPQIPYEPSPRLRYRRDAEASAGSESSGSAGESAGSGSAGSSANSGDSGSSGSSGSYGSSGSSGSGNQAIDGGNGDGPVAAGAGIRGVSAFAVMLVTLVMSSL